MAENQRTRTERDPAEVSDAASPSRDIGGLDDEQRREKQRKRNNDAVNTPPFSGDSDDARAAGVPEQLIAGKDPDAQLID